MFVRQVKRKCSVRGCKNTDCFAISRTREVGNTVIICKSCLGSALGAIDDIKPGTKSNIPELKNAEAPKLFFNNEAFGSGRETVPPVDGTDDIDGVINNAAPLGQSDDVIDSSNNQEDASAPESSTEESAATGAFTSDEKDASDNVQNNQEDASAPESDAENSVADDAENPEEQVFKCSACGKEFESAKGLNMHLRHCKPDEKE